ncbi:hypothetical protein BJ741DRAFT_94423 [Chytriomyces cf. hyalinus JEL632]|nr:hypothetical protein BJ741DRAFT_94423 [Chytriomyces cf. hyalinus JEL632]
MSRDHSRHAVSEQADGRVPRPPNAFILYRKDTQPRLVLEYKGKGRSSRDFSSMVGQMWKSESPVIKAYYQSMAKDRLAEHRRLYPDYCYRPKKDAAAKGKIKPKLPACPYPTPTKPKRSRAQKRFSGRDSDSDSDYEYSDSSAFNSAFSSRAPSPAVSPAEEFSNPTVLRSSNVQTQTVAFDSNMALDEDPVVETDGWISEFSTNSGLSSREGSIASFHQGFDDLQIREVAASIQEDDVHLLDSLLSMQERAGLSALQHPATESTTPAAFVRAFNSSPFCIPSQIPNFQEPSSFPWDAPLQSFALPNFTAQASIIQASAAQTFTLQSSNTVASALETQKMNFTNQPTTQLPETHQINLEMYSKPPTSIAPSNEPFQFVVPSQTRVPSGPKRSSSLRLDTTSAQATATTQSAPKSGIWLTSAKILSPLNGFGSVFFDDSNLATPRGEFSCKQGVAFPGTGGGLLSATTPRAITYGSRVFDFFGSAMSPSRAEASDVKPWFI